MKEWKRAAELILGSSPRPQKVFILGAAGTGKTSFAAFLTSVAAEAGRRAAVIDADVGQAEIGPPGAVGLGFTDRPVERLRDVPADRAFFVGSNSPELLSFTTIAAAKSAVDHALAGQPDVVVIDTTGLVWGRTARFLKNAKVELIEPTHIVALQRELELEHLLRPWDQLNSLGAGPVVVRVPVSPRAVDKTRRDRRSAREKAFKQYLSHAEPRQYDLGRLALFRTTYLTGRPMDPSQTRALGEDLKCAIAHAEWLPDGIFIVADGYFDLSGLEKIKEREGVPEVFLTKAERFEHLLVGLVDAGGQLLSVGTLLSIDFAARQGVILSPLDDLAAARVAGVHFGILKILPGGEEGGKIHPNDI